MRIDIIISIISSIIVCISISIIIIVMTVKIFIIDISTLGFIRLRNKHNINSKTWRLIRMALPLWWIPKVFLLMISIYYWYVWSILHLCWWSICWQSWRWWWYTHADTDNDTGDDTDDDINTHSIVWSIIDN